MQDFQRRREAPCRNVPVTFTLARMATRLHDRSSFFKYTSLSTARKVVESKSFRWSAPTLFNDPFDHQLGFILDESPEAFANQLYDSTLRLIYGDADPTPNPSSEYFRMAMALRSNRARLPRDELLGKLQTSCLEVAQNLHAHLGQLNSVLREQLCRSRVFCVTEAPDNVVMWSHYGHEHRGVVFELACIDVLDNRLLAARRVEYTDRFLRFPSSEAYARHLTGEVPFDLLPLVWKIAFTKHSDWSYEREWRVHIPLYESEGHTILEEPVPVFQAAILGCRVSDSEAAEFAALTRANLPGVKLLRAKISTHSFQLGFASYDAG